MKEIFAPLLGIGPSSFVVNRHLYMKNELNSLHFLLCSSYPVVRWIHIFLLSRTPNVIVSIGHIIVPGLFKPFMCTTRVVDDDIHNHLYSCLKFKSVSSVDKRWTSWTDPWIQLKSAAIWISQNCHNRLLFWQNYWHHIQKCWFLE